MDVLFRAVPVEADFGLTTSTLEDLRATVSALPFDTAVLMYARLAAEAWHAGPEKEAQLAIARDIFPPTAGAIPAIERFLNEHDGGAVFVEQQLLALLRLVIAHAQEGAIDATDAHATERFFSPSLRALFAALTVVTDSIEELPGDDRDQEKWLSVLIQNGGYNAKTAPLNAFTRAKRLLELSQLETVGSPHDRCDIAKWLEDDYRLTFEEQFAVGLSLAGIVGAFDEDRPSAELSLLGRGRFEDLLRQLGLADREDAVRDLITAPRHWYQQRFAEAEATAMDVAWRRAPFEQRPFLQWGDGHLLLISPRALLSWLGEGFQHRVFACAERRGEAVKQRYMRYFGQLVEAYALELTESVYPHAGGTQRVHGEQLYGKSGGKKTSDISVDSTPHLLLIEVGAGRLKEASRVLANWTDVESDLKKLVSVRMKKLDVAIDAILSNEASLPNVDPERLQEIWPVIVTAGSVIQSELLWDYIDANREDVLQQRKVEPLTLLDLDNFELLMGLVENGASLADLLRRKAASPFRNFDLQQWLDHDPTAPKEHRPAVMEDRMHHMFLDFGQRLGFDADQLSLLNQND